MAHIIFLIVFDRFRHDQRSNKLRLLCDQCVYVFITVFEIEANKLRLLCDQCVLQLSVFEIEANPKHSKMD